MSSLAAIRQAKNALRREIKQKLKKLTETEKTRQSSIIAQKVLASDVYKSSQRISVYLPMKDEVDTLAIVKAILADGKECFIPHYEGPDMIMVQLESWAAYQSLPVNNWGIKQPTTFDPSQDAICSGGLDLIFMPGLAFTNQGFRLGRGKGYYDKYLEKCEQSGRMPKTVALLFKEQLVDYVPVLDHDIPIDILMVPESSDSEETNDNK